MRTITTILIVILSIGVLFYIAKESISVNVVPTLQEYISSTTSPVAENIPTATSTIVIDSSISSTTKNISFLTPIKASKGTIYATVAKNPTTREKGLSGVASLDEEEGMLFIFPTVMEQEFWMKDMNFPIDIVWINSDRKIVGVSSNISPETYPNRFSSPSKIQFVLEVNAGFAEKFGLATGTRVIF